MASCKLDAWIIDEPRLIERVYNNVCAFMLQPLPQKLIPFFFLVTLVSEFMLCWSTAQEANVRFFNVEF